MVSGCSMVTSHVTSQEVRHVSCSLPEQDRTAKTCSIMFHRCVRSPSSSVSQSVSRQLLRSLPSPETGLGHHRRPHGGSRVAGESSLLGLRRSFSNWNPIQRCLGKLGSWRLLVMNREGDRQREGEREREMYMIYIYIHYICIYI